MQLRALDRKRPQRVKIFMFRQRLLTKGYSPTTHLRHLNVCLIKLQSQAKVSLAVTVLNLDALKHVYKNVNRYISAVFPVTLAH